MKLILVRHGETVANSKRIFQGQFDSPLTELGKEQAKKVASRLKDEKFDYIYSSPLSRALDTAKEIAKFHKEVPFKIDDDLIEVSMGVMEGKTRKELGIPEQGRPPKYLTDTCESFERLYQRADKYLHKTLTKHKDDIVVLVGHGLWFRAVLAILYGKEPLDIPFLDKLLNTSITIIDIDENRNHKIVSHNCVKHLN